MNAPNIMPFGKFKGLPLDSIPSDYLHWLIDEVDLKPRLWNAVQDELGRRGYGTQSKSSRTPVPVVPVAVTLEVADQVIAEGRRALARKTHPDRGGDGESMAAVNATADWLQGMVGRILQTAERAR